MRNVATMLCFLGAVWASTGALVLYGTTFGCDAETEKCGLTSYAMLTVVLVSFVAAIAALTLEKSPRKAAVVLLITAIVNVIAFTAWRVEVGGFVQSSKIAVAAPLAMLVVGTVMALIDSMMRKGTRQSA